MLFGLWKRVAAAARWDALEAALQRDEFTISALRVDVPRQMVPSWGALTARQVDVLKAVLEGVLGRLPVQATAAGLEPAEDAAARCRLEFAIARDSAAAYGSTAEGDQAIASMLEDMLPPGSPAAAPGKWRLLPLAELEKLAMTTGRARRAKFAKKA
jgi:hypothetical protein